MVLYIIRAFYYSKFYGFCLFSGLKRTLSLIVNGWTQKIWAAARSIWRSFKIMYEFSCCFKINYEPIIECESLSCMFNIFFIGQWWVGFLLWKGLVFFFSLNFFYLYFVKIGKWDGLISYSNFVGSEVVIWKEYLIKWCYEVVF